MQLTALHVQSLHFQVTLSGYELTKNQSWFSSPSMIGTGNQCDSDRDEVNMVQKSKSKHHQK